MRKHNVPKSRYVVVFFITLFIFLFGALLGNYFTTQKFERVQEIQHDITVQTQGAELQYLLLLQDPCKYVDSAPLADQLYTLSEKLDYMESQRGESDPEVVRLKNTYALLEVRHWLFVRKTNEECRTDLVPILYFYSNSGDCPQCKEQDYTLTYLRREYPALRVYAFDITAKNPALDTIKAIYNVNGTPTIILPHTTLGFSTLDDMQYELAGYNLVRHE